MSPIVQPGKETQAAVSPSRMVSLRSAGAVGGMGNSNKPDEWRDKHVHWRDLGHGGYMRPRIIHH